MKERTAEAVKWRWTFPWVQFHCSRSAAVVCRIHGHFLISGIPGLVEGREPPEFSEFGRFYSQLGLGCCPGLRMVRKGSKMSPWTATAVWLWICSRLWRRWVRRERTQLTSRRLLWNIFSRPISILGVYTTLKLRVESLTFWCVFVFPLNLKELYS